MLNIEINRKTLAEKQLQITKNPCWERWNLTQKHLWQIWQNKLNFKNAISDLVDNGKILSDDNSRAKALNMFFKSVFTDESDCVPGIDLNVKYSMFLFRQIK